MVSGCFYAVLAGVCGAAASLSAKLSLGAGFLKQMCASGSGLSGWTQAQGAEGACEWLDVPLRVLCGGLLFVCNAVMWTLFSKALRLSSSSARATVTTTASNFITSVFEFMIQDIKDIYGHWSSVPYWTNYSFVFVMIAFPAVFGHFIFEETQDTLWWTGLSLTLCGLLLLHGSTPPSLQENEEKKDQ